MASLGSPEGQEGNGQVESEDRGNNLSPGLCSEKKGGVLQETEESPSLCLEAVTW